jgi:hypothetical protein
MEQLKNLYQDKKFIFSSWVILLIIAIMNLFNYSFVSNITQSIYYGLYILSTFTYFIAFIWVVLLLTVGRMVFSSNEEIGRIPSPNGAYELVIVSNNQGALGGATITNLDKIYLKTFKYRKWIFYDDWGVENKINWIDNKNFKIDGHIIDVDTKEVIYGDR